MDRKRTVCWDILRIVQQNVDRQQAETPTFMLVKPFAPPLDLIAAPRANRLADDWSTTGAWLRGCLLRDGTRGTARWLLGEELPGEGIDSCKDI